ncbi:MAG TPA: peptidase S8 [Anaerolineae bacterium]|nr:peptidase S8 [Anaerolineae bacterium]
MNLILFYSIICENCYYGSEKLFLTACCVTGSFYATRNTHGGKMSRLSKVLLVFVFSFVLAGITWSVMAAERGEASVAGELSVVENVGVTAVTLTPANLIRDGSFELGIPNPEWAEFSSPIFTTPLCNAASCSSANLARAGSYWAWFTTNGVVTETGYVSQTLVISNAGSAILDFYLSLPTVSGSEASLFRASLDDDVLFELTDTITNWTAYAGYTLVSRNVTGYADGLTHTLRLSATVAPGASYYLDDVSLTVSDAFVYLPAILNNSCGTAVYDEIVRYNMDKIRAPESWDCSQGENVIVAVLDSGVNLTHPDLQANIVTGATFVPGTTTPEDDHGHGTHVAGIVAAVINNGGAAGVAPQAQIMPVKVLDASGSGSLAGIAQGITWATNNGANVINLSLGTSVDVQSLADAVDYAYNNGVLVVASAGNCGDPATWHLNNCLSLDSPSWPAAYANAMAVAATDQNDNQSSFSTTYSYVEIAAPGSNIYSTYLNGGYTFFSGTSQAAPHVAGLAAAVWSRQPQWTNAQVRAAIQNTAVDLGAPGRDDQFGYGRIDAYEAVFNGGGGSSEILTAVSPITTANGDAPYAPGELLFKLEPGYTVAQVLGGALASLDSIQVTEAVPELGVKLMSVPVGEEETAVAALSATEGVAYAELNYIFSIND